MPTVLMHTRPLDEKEKIITGPRVAWLPPYTPLRFVLDAVFYVDLDSGLRIELEARYEVII